MAISMIKVTFHANQADGESTVDFRHNFNVQTTNGIKSASDIVAGDAVLMDPFGYLIVKSISDPFDIEE